MTADQWIEAPKLRDGNSFAETYVEPIYEKVLSKERDLRLVFED